MEALLVFLIGPAAKLQHLPFLHGLERTKLNLGSDFGPSDLEVKVKHNSMICNDFPTAFWIERKDKRSIILPQCYTMIGVNHDF